MSEILADGTDEKWQPQFLGKFSGGWKAQLKILLFQYQGSLGIDRGPSLTPQHNLEVMEYSTASLQSAVSRLHGDMSSA